jgi:hypothetical protein
VINKVQLLKCLITVVEFEEMYGLPLLGRGNEGEAGYKKYLIK